MADINKNNTTEFGKGLNLDSAPQLQPDGTYRFALNAVNETELGDVSLRSNEESNEFYTNLTPGYTPIGKCYIGNNQTAILSVSPDNIISEIGIMDANQNYTVHVNDANTTRSRDKLGFKVERQIQMTYRLRKGCERTIYFTGKGYPPRYYNFDKPNQFKRGGEWAAPKFNLYKKIEVFPTVDSIEVQDSNGALLPGSYSIFVQHMDEDFNGTEFYELVKDVNIINDLLNKTYSDLEGSSHIGENANPYKYGKTNKAIKIVLDAVDTNFTYVRFGFAERTGGTGKVTRVVYSDPISVFNPIFTYTGNNGATEGTIEELELFNMNSGIQTAEHIEQIDNMLILSNVKGEQAKICNLQRYASQIKTDCFVKDIILTSVKEQHNPKNPLVVHNGLTYQPGEVASLGIMYIYEDYTVSPICHIPGKSPLAEKGMIYAPGSNVHPMSNENNQNVSEVYLDNATCEDVSYWGLDSEGNPLKNKNVRHHRFPTREEINVGFVKRTQTTGDTVKYKRVELFIGGIVKKSDTSTGYVAKDFNVIVRFKRNGLDETFQDGIYPDSNIKPSTLYSNIYLDSEYITDIKVYTQEIGTTQEVEIPLVNNESELQENGLTYKVSVGQITENNVSHIYTVPILGLKFSNIIIPREDEIGKKIIGYQIVRQERRDIDKTILDSGVVFPMQKSGRNVATAMLAPEFFTDSSLNPSSCEGSEDATIPTCFNISKRNLMIVAPEHRFMDKSHDGFTTIQQVGVFEREYVGRTAFSLQNVYDGTSATGDEDKKTDDDDGFSLRHGVRFTGVKYSKTKGAPLSISNDNVRMYNLEAVNYADTEDNNETLYNLSFDNKALILSSTKPGVDLRTYGPGRYNFPYVYFKKDNLTFYQNFRSNPYYLIDNRVFTEDTCTVFGGDTYIAPLRYSNHIFGNAAAALRRKKMSVWALIGSIVIALIGVALAIFSGGTSLVIAGGIIIALGAVATGMATLIETAKFTEIYGDKWQANLDRTVFDFIYARLFVREHPHEQLGDDYDRDIDPWYLSWADDTFRWFGDVVGDLWFETQLNISLRVPPMNMENNYLRPLKPYMNDNTSQLMNISQAEYVSNNSIGSGRFHRYIDPSVGPTTPEEWYFYRKIINSDSSRPTGIKYSGVSVPQVYLVNPDHYVTSGIKKFYTLPLEYDCCSECTESFPHRIHYSQQSFQEEKSDNYRIFLPNNYRDIEGETGPITNIFRLGENLYAHTKEALWKMSRKYQERVTNEIVSFIGTGSYFDVPPEKIIDDDTGSSAGTKHKWSGIKTPAGYFFVSENQRKIYQFDGKSLLPISNTGLSNWFRENLGLELDANYLKAKGTEYPYADNPSNILGTGFITAYDTKKERILFTKKDLALSDEVFQGGTENGICMQAGNIVIFPNMTQTIIEQSQAGWTFGGVDSCKLKFYKDVVKTRIEVRYITQSIFKDVDYLVFRYNFTTADGRDLDTRTQLLQPTQSQPLGWCQNTPNTDYIGWATDNTGYGVEAVLINIKKIKEDFPNTPDIVFNSKAWWYGERWSGNMNMNAEGYKGGTMVLDPNAHDFINNGGVLQGVYSFQTINIPEGGRGTCNPNPTNIGNFTYTIENGQLSWDGVSGGEIPVDTITIRTEVEVQYVEREYMYIEGTLVENPVQYNNSWTISYSLKDRSWTSWHSYMPNFYINTPERLYSWMAGFNSIWRHNVTGRYGTFYGLKKPFILDYVSTSKNLSTMIWDSLDFIVDSKSYDPETKEYVHINDFFNKAVFYNTSQCSGLLNVILKDNEAEDYYFNQINNLNVNEIIVDRNEKNWSVNNLRDIRVDYTKPIWTSKQSLLQENYYIDKVLNSSTLDYYKDWSQMESFRDKYLAVRLIFDKFADTKLIMNFSNESENLSTR